MMLYIRSIYVISIGMQLLTLPIYGNVTQRFVDCLNLIIVADSDESATMNRTEFLLFQRNMCNKTSTINVSDTALTTTELNGFNALACLCRTDFNADVKCCDGLNAQVKVPNVQDVLINVMDTPTEVDDRLNSVCVVARSTCEALKNPTTLQLETYPPTAPISSPTSSDIINGSPAASPISVILRITSSPSSISVYEPGINAQRKQPTGGTDRDPSGITTDVSTSSSSGSINRSIVFLIGILFAEFFIVLIS